jgi:hypothetical protein
MSNTPSANAFNDDSDLKAMEDFAFDYQRALTEQAQAADPSRFSKSSSASNSDTADTADSGHANSDTTNTASGANDLDPEPLRRRLPAATAYPVDALGAIMGPAAKEMQTAIQAPMALIGSSLLAAASLAVQPLADVTIDGRQYPTTLWLLSIAESGERKTAVDGYALSAHKGFQKSEMARRKIERESYLLKQKAYDATSAALSKGKVASDELQQRLADLGPVPKAPPSGLLMCTEPTLEAVQKEFLAGASSLGLFSDEGGQFLGGHGMSKDHSLKTAAGLCKLWDDGTGNRVRAGDGVNVFYGRRFALHVMLQPVVANALFADQMLAGQGFLARSLITAPATTAGTRWYRSTNVAQLPEVLAFHQCMAALLAVPHQLKDDGELEPRSLPLSAAAKARWIEIHDAFEKRILTEFASIRPWASKAAEQAARIAGVLALVERSDAPRIEEHHLNQAARLTEHYISETVRLIESAMLSPETSNGIAIIEWCVTKGHAKVTSEMLMQLGPGHIRKAEVITAAMARLTSTRWAVPLAGKAKQWIIRIDKAHLLGC